MSYQEPVMEDFKGRVHSFESFGLVDGEGVRFVVFLQGCPMRCRYCHNPETWNTDKGNLYSAQEVFDRAYRYKAYWKNNGGITVSGGEPLLQIDFLIQLFRICREHNVNTCIDTSGICYRDSGEFHEKFLKLMEYTDMVILDIKEIDREKHRLLTGQYNDNILEMGRKVSELGKRLWIRHVLVPGLTDDIENLRRTREYIDSLNCEKVEILPYHTLGIAKWLELGLNYTLMNAGTPTKEQIEEAEKALGIESI